MAFENRLDPGQAIVNFDHFSNQCFETGFHACEAIFKA